MTKEPKAACRAERAGLRGSEVRGSEQSSYPFTARPTDRSSHNGMYIRASLPTGSRERTTRLQRTR